MKKVIFLCFVFVSLKIYSQSQAICAGSPVTLHANPAAIPNSTLIFPGTTTVSTTSSNGVFVFSPSVTANYTIWTSANNSQVLTVTVNPMPLVNPTYTIPSCTSTLGGFNFHLTFNPASPQPSYSITWAIPPPLSNIPLVPACITSITDYSCIGYITPGVYQASITAAGGCSVVASFT
ncbi:MAG: hypothetical protein WCR21_10280, partial [Bacteroidota bacterium]